MYSLDMEENKNISLWNINSMLLRIISREHQVDDPFIYSYCGYLSEKRHMFYDLNQAGSIYLQFMI
jgi:hypothetical protein